MWKIGHRGASGHYPENTILAFRKAIELGANALELDVHACKSGEAVVIHDDTLKRTTAKRGRVDAFTLSELQNLDAGDGERIPTLEAVLDEFASKYVIFIEIKAAGASAPVAGLITERARQGIPYAHMPVIGFHEEWLQAARALDGNILIGMTPDDGQPLDPAYCALAKARSAWVVDPSIGQLNADFVNAAHALELKVITWTANTRHEITKAKSLGVDGIISDFPERL